MHILLVEESRDCERILFSPVASWLQRLFENANIFVAHTASAGIAVMVHERVDLVLTDYDLGDHRETGITLLNWVIRNRPKLLDHFVFLTRQVEPVRPYPRVLLRGAPARDAELYLTELMQTGTV